MSTTVAAAADPAGLRLWVRNVVAVARVADALPLAALATRIPGAAHPKKNYPGIFLRVPGTKAACHVYESGKVVLTGLAAVDRIGPALAAVVETLRAAGAELLVPVPAARVINLVATGNLGMKIALSRFALALELERIEYDPEQLAGLVYRARAGGTALVFASGAIVVMGARSLEQAQAVATEVRDVIDGVGAWHLYA
ncbi:MAG: hypothetical protein ABFC38_09565 [Methanospirillum sp.]